MLSKKTILRLRKTQKRILSHANQFNLLTFGSPTEAVQSTEVLENACNTQACIGGEALLSGGRAYFVGRAPHRQFELKRGQDCEVEAQKYLGLTQEQAISLFYLKEWRHDGRGWPDFYATAYNVARTHIERAHVAVARIEHFISRGGEE